MPFQYPQGSPWNTGNKLVDLLLNNLSPKTLEHSLPGPATVALPPFATPGAAPVRQAYNTLKEQFPQLIERAERIASLVRVLLAPQHKMDPSLSGPAAGEFISRSSAGWYKDLPKEYLPMIRLEQTLAQRAPTFFPTALGHEIQHYATEPFKLQHSIKAAMEQAAELESLMKDPWWKDYVTKNIEHAKGRLGGPWGQEWAQSALAEALATPVNELATQTNRPLERLLEKLGQGLR